ncbi:MAG: general secretion pathway protein GspB [Aquabacterium sp.]|nr:general secretion pathway protein GspB [Aquabacterium sp.]
MSYILDALKKADAERERGSVPGLHSQPLGQVDDDEDAAPRRPVPPAMWLVAGAGLCLIAVLSWQLLSRPSAPEPVAATAAVAEAPPAQNTPPAQPAPTVAPPVAEPPAPQPTLAAAPPPTPVPPAAPVVREPPARAQPPAAQPPKPVAQAAPPTQAARVPAMSELPEDIKRDLPPLTIGGAMYSDTPTSRMLIINSQVFHEGDQPYQGLVLEEIRLKSAVFKYRGYRYAINY